jgi:hypothetical protein
VKPNEYKEAKAIGSVGKMNNGHAMNPVRKHIFVKILITTVGSQIVFLGKTEMSSEMQG